MVSFNTASQFNNLGLLNSQFAALQGFNPQSLTQFQGLNGFQQGFPGLQGFNGFPQSFPNLQGFNGFQGQQGIFGGLPGLNGQQPPSPEELFSTLDSNGDGSLTQTEFDNGPKPPGLPEPTDAMKTAMWQRLDADSSGTVSLTEFEQAGPPPGGPGGFGQFGGINGQFGGLTDAQRTQRRTEEFTTIDTNGDGSISQTELDNMPAPSDGRPAPTAQMKADMLQRMDTDGNGSISEDEFVNAPPPPFPPGGGQFGGINGQFGFPGGPQPNPAERAQRRAAEFSNIDTNSDGSISQTELDNMPAPTDGRPAPTAQMKAEMLNRMDTDGNGSISEDEFVNAPPPPRPQGIPGQFGSLQGTNFQQLPAGFQNLLSQFGGNINFSNLFSNTV